MTFGPDSTRALRTCCQALVLIDLVFVHMTGAADLAWLAPLFVLTLVAPWLERLRENLVYRCAWNAAVVGVFLVLVRHAMGRDLASVLEDGLLLAVMCQVHLLNNLRSEQRPDLLFFNAFLIAIVTGYLCRSVGFPLAFACFAPCFVVGLELLSATADGSVLAARATRGLCRDGALRAAWLLPACFLVFAFWPRDFERGALFGDTFDLSGPEDLELGASDSLSLDRRGEVDSINRPALRVTVLEGVRADVPSLWRGTTLGAAKDGGWDPLPWRRRRTASAAEETWSEWQGNLVRPAREGFEGSWLRVEVVRFAQRTQSLFAPLGTCAVELAPAYANGSLVGHFDGTLGSNLPGDVGYELAIAPVAGLLRGGARARELAPELEPYVELPPAAGLERARGLAARLARELPAEVEQQRLVAHFRAFLEQNYVYVAPGSEHAARDLDEFLSGDAGGHCEFFASALATLLRSARVPCRVATGFRGTRWDPAGKTLSIGTRDAHAWVEVHDPRAGWVAVDPSPLVTGVHPGSSLWARVGGAARSAWKKVTSYDAAGRAAFAAWLRALPRQVIGAARGAPLLAGLVGLVPVLVLVLLVRRRHARTAPELRAYRAALRRARLGLLPGETPRELLLRARRTQLAPAQLEALGAATRAHEAGRYAA